MNAPRVDHGRTAVYAAEMAAFDGTDLEVVRPVVEILALIESLAASTWWHGPVVRARPARRNATSSTTHCAVTSVTANVIEIRVSATLATVATAAHELAHALAGVAHGHDAVFRAAYLDVIEVITNIDPADRRGDLHRRQLDGAFNALGLPIGERAWPPPDPTMTSAIAL